MGTDARVFDDDQSKSRWHGFELRRSNRDAKPRRHELHLTRDIRDESGHRVKGQAQLHRDCQFSERFKAGVPKAHEHATACKSALRNLAQDHHALTLTPCESILETSSTSLRTPIRASAAEQHWLRVVTSSCWGGSVRRRLPSREFRSCNARRMAEVVAHSDPVDNC